jgi:hypothetical protein
MDEIELARIAQEALKKFEVGLAKGERFYDSRGHLLTTPQEILECLLREHKVKVDTNEPDTGVAPNMPDIQPDPGKRSPRSPRRPSSSTSRPRGGSRS